MDKKKTNKMKYEVAREVGVNLKDSDLTAKQAGTVGGQMVKKMVNKTGKKSTSKK